MTQSQLTELLETESARSLIEAGEERGWVEPAELEAFASAMEACRGQVDDGRRVTVCRLIGWLTRVGYRILPVVWRLDPSFDARVRFEEVQKVGTVEQLDRFALGEVVGCFAVSTCRDEYVLRCALVLECP